MATSTVTPPPGYTVETPQSTLPAGYTIEQPRQSPDTSGQQTNDIGKTVIVPKEGESFEDTMNRGVAQGQKTTTQDVSDELATAPGKVAETLAAAPVAGAVGAAGLATAGGTVSTAAGLTGAALQPIKDAIMEELPYLKSSPGPYVEHVAKQAVQWVMENPEKALSLATKGGIIAAAAKMLLSRAGL